MLIWKGHGLYVPIFFVVPMLIITTFADNQLVWNIIRVVLIASAATAVWFVGRKLNRDKNEIIEIDQETRKETKLGYQHTLFFIPFEFWSIILVILSTRFVMIGSW